MVKKAIFVSALAFTTLFAQTNKKDLEVLLKELQALQKSLVTKNVTESSKPEIDKMKKQIQLLRQKMQYLSIQSNYEKKLYQTKDNLKKIATSLYYIAKTLKKNHKVYYYYKDKFEIDGKKELIIGDNDIANIMGYFLSIEDSFNKLKRDFIISKQRDTLESYKNFIQKAVNFIKRYNDKIVLSPSGNDKYVGLDFFKNCDYKMNDNINLLIIKRCNFE